MRTTGAAMRFKEYEAAGHALKIPVQSLEVRGPNPDLEGHSKLRKGARERAHYDSRARC